MTNTASPTHRSTQRVFQILEMIANTPTGLTFTEISSGGAIPKSSLSPLLSTLTEEQYLFLDQGNKKYHIGKNLYFLGRAYLKSGSLYQLLSREVQVLATSLESTTYLNVLQEGKSVYQFLSDTYTSVNVIRTPKFHLPAYATATGKALLSRHSFSQLESLYQEPFQALTPNTIKDLHALWDELEQYRTEGYYREREESTLFIQCTAVPLEVEGEVVAALSVAQHVLEYSEEKQKLMEKKLSETKLLIEQLILDHLDQWQSFCE